MSNLITKPLPVKQRVHVTCSDESSLVLTFRIKQDTFWINWVDYNQWTPCNTAVSNKVQMWYLLTVCEGWSQVHCLEIQTAFSRYVLQYNFMCCHLIYLNPLLLPSSCMAGVWSLRYKLIAINFFAHWDTIYYSFWYSYTLITTRQATMCTLIYTCSYACFIGKLSYNSFSCASSLMEVKCPQREL